MIFTNVVFFLFVCGQWRLTLAIVILVKQEELANVI